MKRKSKIILTASSLLILAVAVPAALMDFSVQGTTDFLSDVKATVAEHDKDGDGKLQAKELGSRAWMLLMMDSNKDGGLTVEEMKSGMATLSQRIFHSRDAKPSETASPAFESEQDPRRGPRPLKASEWAVDSLVPDLEVEMLSGEIRKLHTLTGSKGAVIAVLCPECPLSRRWLPALQRIETTYAAQGVPFIYVAAPDAETSALTETGMAGVIVRDKSGHLLQALKASHTTDVFVLDAAKTLIYRGAVDDQYGLGYSREKPGQLFLNAALEALMAGRRPRIAATLAPGCELELPPATTPVPEMPVTWHNRISRLSQAHCVRCHHEGGAGPFPLETHAQFIRKAKTIRRVLEEGVMPPWQAAAADPPAHTPWLNESTLPEADKAAMLAWIDGNREEGNPQEAPLARVWDQNEKLASPDLLLQLPEPVQVQAEGTMPYQSVFVDTNLKEDQWVSAWEVRPSVPGVVHHVLVYVYPPGRHMPGEAERRGHLASWVPGHGPAIYPDGYAKALPAGSRLRFEIHYTPIGKAVQEQMQLALRFAPRPPDFIVETAGVADVRLAIPPGARRHAEAAEWTVPSDIRILALSPHMHFRGKAMRFEAALPGKELRTLLEVPRYDFNWQIPVMYAEPLPLPKGSVIKVTGWFDNSADNPANPDPSATVHWGSQTGDEMMIGYVEYCRPRETGVPVSR